MEELYVLSLALCSSSLIIVCFFQARFRVYGLVTPILPARFDALFDLAHVFSGGRVVCTSDQHFGVGSNLILPGRGKDILT